MRRSQPLLLLGCFLVTGCSLRPQVKPSPESGAMTITSTLLNPGTPIETPHNLVLHAKELPDHNYHVLFGPYPPNDQTPARGQLRNSSPTFDLSVGWALLIGRWPLGTMRRISIGSVGTTIVMQVDGDIDRVYMLEGDHPVRIALLNNEAIFKDITPGQYVEARPGEGGDVLSKPSEIPTKGPLAEFLAYVESRTAAAQDSGVLP